MEPNCNEKIEVLLKRIIELLKNNDQQKWSEFLQNALINFTESTNKNTAIIPIIKSMLGGSGSLSDVVLYKDGKPLLEENNELYSLLNDLYDTCKRYDEK